MINTYLFIIFKYNSLKGVKYIIFILYSQQLFVQNHYKYI